MKIEIERYCKENPNGSLHVSYELPFEDVTLLEALTYVKTHLDNTLSFSSGCASSICGSCAMRVNGREVLACAYKIQEGDVISSLSNMPKIRDLVVDFDKALQFNSIAKAHLIAKEPPISVSREDEKRNELQSDCILCGSCYSACPVYSVNENFIGPFALTRTYKYVTDARENDMQAKIEAIQSNGIWDCTLCNECVPVCPQDIAPKQDIVMLQNQSGVLGYMNPKFASFDGGFGSFDGSPTF